MADLTNLIEDIRTALAFSESVSPGKLSGFAREYAEECTKLNDRLKQCLPHLRGGNIAEAVRLAEASPSVTETFNLLDFETRQDWHEVCDGLGLDVAPPLAVEIFQELNDAYLQMTSLEPLLKWHRIHALNGSPLRDRLAVLRSIAKADPMNLHWQADQETFEKARIQEIGKEIADALAQKEVSRLQELFRELTAPDWQIAPPSEYRQKICTAVLENYADELMRHFSAFNHLAAVSVYQSMEQVLFANRMAMPAAIEKNIRAAVQWISETANEALSLDQFQVEIAQLRDALEVYTPRQTLENYFYALQNTAARVNMAIPKDLESHYYSRLTYLTKVEQRRFYVVVTAFAGSIILVAAFLIYALTERAFMERVAQTLETLQKIETENRIDDIDQALNAVKPDVAKSPKVEPVVTRLRQILEKDNERTKEFERYYHQASSLMDQKPDMDGLKAVKSSIDQANHLKRTAQEITQFTDLRSKYDRLFQEEQNKADREFSGQFAKHSQEFNVLPRTPNPQYPPDELSDQLNSLAANVRNLLAQYPNISEQQKREGSNLLTSINSRIQSIQKLVAETEGFRQVLSRIRDLPSCKNVLQDFSTRFPDHPVVDDIKNLLKDFDSIQEAAESLQALCRNYKNVSSNLKNQYDLAAAKVANIELVFPFGERVSTLASMKPIESSTFKATEELLKTIAQRDLYPWIDERGNWYFLTAKPEIDASGKVSNTNQLEFVTTLISQPKEFKITSNTAQVVERNKGNYDLIQSTFSRDALKQLDKITANPAEQRDAAEIIGGLLVKVNGASGIDPILKIILLDSFISDYSKVDPVFAENFNRVASLINDSDMELSSNWMEVESRSIVGERQKANVILDRLAGTTDLKALVDKTKKETNEFRQKLFEANPRFEFVGLLLRQDRQWICSQAVASLPSPSGKLFVLQMSDGTAQAVQVGTVRDGKITLSSGINVLQCSPAFFVN